MLKQIYYLLISFLYWPIYLKDCIFFILDASKNNLKSKFGIYACLTDRTVNMGFDPHYIYHPAWAARILKKTNPKIHYDFSSTITFTSIASAFIDMKFFDYRKAVLKGLSGIETDQADLLNLPFDNNSLDSISCMHTIEHIGLGRYGDPIDSLGHLKAAKELSRVLAKNGTFLFVTPVGSPKTYLNAHRVFSYEQVLDMFAELKLVESALIPDNHLETGIIYNPEVSLINKQKYGCGCFVFTKL